MFRQPGKAALSRVFENGKEGDNSADDANDPNEEAQHSSSGGQGPVPLVTLRP
jgi:hypothetical protein